MTDRFNRSSRRESALTPYRTVNNSVDCSKSPDLWHCLIE